MIMQGLAFIFTLFVRVNYYYPEDTGEGSF
ncbi:hypothetical protein BH20ACI2_BH20ACI2_22210 [soil metagenome]